MTGLSKAEQSINRSLYRVVNPFSHFWVGVSVLRESKFELSNLEGRLPQAKCPRVPKRKKAKSVDFTVKDYITMAQSFVTDNVPESKAQ